MRVIRTGKALADLVRLHAFLSPVTSRAAAALLARLKTGPRLLVTHIRLGESVPEPPTSSPGGRVSSAGVSDADAASRVRCVCSVNRAQCFQL